MSTLEVKNLHVSIEGKAILKGLDLKMQTGEIHAIMGPNGTGKSTLSEAIMGNPAYTITEGEILLDGENILDWAVDERARAGLFLAMQYPAEIPGVTNAEFIRSAINARLPKDEPISIRKYLKDLEETMDFLDMPFSMAERYLNEPKSGLRISFTPLETTFKASISKPKFAILDEIDSGLDIDALKVVSKGVNEMRSPDFGSLIITHYQRLLNYIVPDVVHVMMDGRIVTTGGPDLAKRLEAEGYAGLRDELGLDIKLAEDKA